MVKLIIAVKRHRDFSPERFHQYWRTTHADLLRTNPASKKYIRRYIQCHTLPEEYERGEPAYDGTAEVWFDSVEDVDAFFKDPGFIDGIGPDADSFCDMEATKFFMTLEEAVIGSL